MKRLVDISTGKELNYPSTIITMIIVGRKSKYCIYDDGRNSSKGKLKIKSRHCICDCVYEEEFEEGKANGGITENI